jgi:hypothetical protein
MANIFIFYDFEIAIKNKFVKTKTIENKGCTIQPIKINK